MTRGARTRARQRAVVLAIALALAFGGAATPVARADAPADDATLAAAKDLFRKGVALLEQKDDERALDYFSRSRALRASAQNTMGAAACLQHLGRYDEALDLVEEVVTRFRDDLDEENKRVVGPILDELRSHVGTLEVTSNTSGELFVDGRARGAVPAAAPLHVKVGAHTLRVARPGYRTAEASFDVVARKATAVDAHLDPLPGRGVLRVEDATLLDGEVFVDGARVGAAPWEGTLPVGRHLVWTARGDRGAPPTSFVIIDGQTTLGRLTSRALGPRVHLRTSPAGAALQIDGAAIGSDSWEGRLPVGSHEIVARLGGYHAARSVVDVDPAGAPVDRTLALALDPDDPRWPRLARFEAGMFGGVALTGSAGGEAARVANASLYGPLVGARVGFRFPIGLAAEVSAAYASLDAKFTRHQDTLWSDHAATCVDKKRKRGCVRDAEADWTLRDDVWERGGLFAATASYRHELGPISLVARAGGGITVLHSSDPVDGTVRTCPAANMQTSGCSVTGQSTARRRPFHVSDDTQVLTSHPFFAEAELGVEVPYRDLALGAVLAVYGIATEGPSYTHAQAGVTNNCSGLAAFASGCLGNSALLANERAYGVFSVWVPEVTVRYRF